MQTVRECNSMTRPCRGPGPSFLPSFLPSLLAWQQQKAKSRYFHLIFRRRHLARFFGLCSSSDAQESNFIVIGNGLLIPPQLRFPRLLFCFLCLRAVASRRAACSLWTTKCVDKRYVLCKSLKLAGARHLGRSIVP